MADIILIAVIIISIYIGAKRGLVRTLFTTLSTFISLILTALIYTPFSKALYNSPFGSYIKELTLSFFAEKFQNTPQHPMINHAAETSSVLIVNIVSFVLVIIVIRIFLAFLFSILNITAKLPVIKQFNSILGMVIGAVGGILISYIAIGIIAALGGDGNIGIIQESIQKSYLAIKIYNNNLVTNLLLNFLN